MMADSGTRSKTNDAEERYAPFEKRGYVPKPPSVTPVPPKGGTAVVSWPSAKVPPREPEQTGA
jgi:hypothetical protein